MTLAEITALLLKEAPEMESLAVKLLQVLHGEAKPTTVADVTAAEASGEASIAADDAAAEAAAKAKDATKAP